MFINLTNYMQQERQAQLEMLKLVEELKAQGFRPLGDGPLADCFIKEEEAPPEEKEKEST